LFLRLLYHPAIQHFPNDAGGCMIVRNDHASLKKMKNCSPYACACLVAALLAVSIGVAVAQGYPIKPVRMVVPFPAGGATDIVGRIVAQKLSEALGQQVIVDNRGGAGGTIGSDMVAKSPPDGYTILVATSSTHAIAPSLYGKLADLIVVAANPLEDINNVRRLLLVLKEGRIVSDKRN
jgi:tripartite-type tricarboxylate transporter receptor subunit TctC